MVGRGGSGVGVVVGLLDLLERLLRRVLPQDGVLVLQLVDALHQFRNLLLQDLHLLSHREHQVGLNQILQTRHNAY